MSTSCSLLPDHCEDQAVTRPSELVIDVHLRPGMRGAGERSVSVTGTSGAGVPVRVSRIWHVIGGREDAILRFVYWYGFGFGVGIVGVGGGGVERCARRFERRDGAEDGGISMKVLQIRREEKKKDCSTYYEESIAFPRPENWLCDKAGRGSN